MKRPLPTGRERRMKPEDLFFSRTDRRGVIEFGNEVFVQMAQYPREQMIGAPHSLIRHPDMPRSVFQLFWDTLKSNRPIGAYVKNLAADGSYYWVFAVAFPVGESYLSIRLRPASPLFEAAQKLYQEVLREEERTDMERGRALLLKALGEFGFSDYEDFMAQALALELGLRDQDMKALVSSGQKLQADQNEDPVLHSLRQVNKEGAETFREIFAVVNAFIQSQKVFTDQTIELLRRFKVIRFLSINMTASAEKFGSSASTLAVISGQFQKMAAEIEALLRDFVRIASELSQEIKVCGFDISSLKLQMDMVDAFVRESLEKTQGAGFNENVFQDLRDNRGVFEELAGGSVQKVLENLTELHRKTMHFSSTLGEIGLFASGLETVRQMGSIESSRKPELQSAFENQIKELKAFTEFLRGSSEKLAESTEVLRISVNEIQIKISRGGVLLHQIFERALSPAHRNQDLPRSA